MKKITVIIAMAALLTGCAHEKEIQGKWKVIEIGNKKTPVSILKTPTIQFDIEKMEYHAVTGVNLLNGKIITDSNNIKFSDGAMTQMAADSISMDFERHFISSLSSVSSFRFSSDTLILLDNSHIEAIKLIPR